jgi:dTMP kinase
MLALQQLVDELREMAANDTGVLAAIVIFRETPENGIEVLITKRGSSPFKGWWALPGGHVEENETVEDGARREAAEETGLKLKKIHMLKPWNPGYPQFGHNKSGATFWAKVKPTALARAGSDAAEIEWCPIGKLPRMAFQDNARIHHAASFAFSAHKTVEAIIQSPASLTEDVIDDQVNDILKSRSQTKKGLFIVFEGIDGVGKTTQTGKLVDWLDDRGYDVKTTKWNSSKLLSKTIKKAKKKKVLTPVMFSILHAADMIVRYEQDVVPALEDNGIVVMDRYIYTSYVRDKVRGVDTKLLNYVYEGMRHPDLIFYCTAPVRLAFERLVGTKGVPSYYAAGMDIGFSHSAEESAVKYAHACDVEYKKVFKDVPNVHVLDMNRSIEEIFEDVKTTLANEFGIGKYKK